MSDQRNHFAAAWRRAGGLLVVVNCVAILVAAIALRVWRLDNIPGVNGDEAQYGVHAIWWLEGEPIPLRTNTGNPLNVFFYGPQIALHAIAPPGFALLRSVAAASGILALGLNFLLAWRLLGMRAAVISTLLLAVLPINVAYSRFAWDASQSLPATLLVIYGSLGAAIEPARRGRWLTLAIASSAAAVLIHPTNVFIVLFVVLALLFGYRQALAERLGWHRGFGRRLALCGALAIVALCGAAAVRYAGHFGTGRFPTIGEAAAFARNYERLFSGVTIYRYIPGSQLEADARIPGMPWDVGLYDLAAVAVVLLGVVLWRSTSRAGATQAADTFLLFGCALTTAAFFLVAGPRAIEPHWERYGIVLIAPGALLLARAVERVRWTAPRTARIALVAGFACAWLLLGGFYWNYFAFIERTGGRSHDTFRTAPVEPRRAALEYVLEQSRGPTTIVTPDWWNYWSLAYLALGHEGVRVLRPEDVDRATIRESGARENFWLIEYADEGGAAGERETTDSATAHAHTIHDFAGRPLLWIRREHRGGRLATSRFGP